MAKTKKPHTVFFLYGKDEVDSVETGAGPRRVAQLKREELADRERWGGNINGDKVLVYAGAVGDPTLTFVEEF